MRKLLILLALVLMAASCGGSDTDGITDNATVDDGVGADVADTTDTAEATDTAGATDTAAVDANNDAGENAGGDTSPAEAEADSTSVQTRDCIHQAAQLTGPDLELPPEEKPDVDDEYLGEYDELTAIDLIEGSGDVAEVGATVGMRYVGVLGVDGTEFDASWNRGSEPFVFTLGVGQVIAGWDEGIEGMQVGGRRVLQIPSDKAYGEESRGEVIGENADLLFIVDLIDVSPTVPNDALGEFDELQIIDLVEGDGCLVQLGDIVAVNYVGVTGDDGTEFDSSWSRGDTFRLTAGLSQVIDGWNEGIIGMKVGGERLLQIPSEMAYGEGDLVFRVHLEELIEPPLAHGLVFDGDAPDDVEITTLVEGSGEGAKKGDAFSGHVAVVFYNDSTLAQSTWEQGQPTQLLLEDGAATLEGLIDGLVGIKAGETRQIILPVSVAYPEGPPPNLPLETDDAVVFVVEAISIIVAG